MGALAVTADDGVNSTFEAFVYLGPSPEESCWRRERTELLTEAIIQFLEKQIEAGAQTYETEQA